MPKHDFTKLFAAVVSIAVMGSGSALGQTWQLNQAGRSSGKVVDIYPIGHKTGTQDVAEEQGLPPLPPVAQDSDPAIPGGQPLPGLPPLEILPEQDTHLHQGSDIESLPHSMERGRHIVAGPGGDYPVNWVGLNNPAPRHAELPSSSVTRHVGNDRQAARPISYSVRRPTPPPPVINTYLPAIHHIPVHIQVVPMGWDPYPWWNPQFYGTPAHGPLEPLPPPNYSLETQRVWENPYVVRPYAPVVRMDRPVEAVSFPQPNYFISQPTQRVYGVYLQPFSFTGR